MLACCMSIVVYGHPLLLDWWVGRYGRDLAWPHFHTHVYWSWRLLRYLYTCVSICIDPDACVSIIYAHVQWGKWWRGSQQMVVTPGSALCRGAATAECRIDNDNDGVWRWTWVPRSRLLQSSERGVQSWHANVMLRTTATEATEVGRRQQHGRRRALRWRGWVDERRRR